MKNALQNMLIACSTVLICTFSLNIFAQSDSSFVKSDRNGSGNNTFNVSVTFLESIINANTTIKMLESKLGKWSTYGNLNDIGANYDENTKDFTIPLYQIHYESATKSRYYAIQADVSQSLKNPIKSIYVTLTLNGDQLAEFKKSLTARGYWLNENLTKILRKKTYKNKAEHLITIRPNNNGSYTIAIIK